MMKSSSSIFYVILISQVIQNDLSYEQWEIDEFRWPELIVAIAVAIIACGK